MTELEEKTERLLRMLEAQDLNGVLLTTQPNFSWLTGGGTNGIDLSRETGAGALLVRRDGRRFVLANSIEMPRLLAEELSEKDFEPIDFSWEEEKTSPSFLAKRAADLLTQNRRMGTDAAGCDVTTSIDDVISMCRFQLTPAEIERFRLLGHDSGELLGELMPRLTPGQTEKEVAQLAADALATRDIQCVVLLVAGDERIQRFRHPVPTARSWAKTVMVVVCARRHGLIASLTRIVCAGAKPDDLARRTNAAAHVNARLFAATRPGINGADLYRIAAGAYAEVGYPGEERMHHQGGACGYRTRDWVAHPLSADEVKLKQAFAWNPSVTGTKVEETCLTTPDGVETITASPNWPAIAVEFDGRSYLSPDVLSL